MAKQWFKKGDIIRQYEVVGDKVNTHIIVNEEMVFNPTLTMFHADGWEDYTPEPIIPTLDEIKQEKIWEIDRYDTSEAVNQFFINNQALWLDKDTRVGLNFSLAMEEAAGKTESTLWYNNIRFDLPITLYKQMLTAVELYAKECYNVTAQHKSNVLSLETEEEVVAYDYTTGYPEKVSFTTNIE